MRFKTKTSKPNRVNTKLIKNDPSLKNILYFLLTILIFNIIYISAILYYLSKLKDCTCFQIKNKINYSNINYLIIIESIILFMYIISLIATLYSISIINNPKSGGGKSFNPSQLISLIIMILIYGYFVYYVYKLYENVDKDCECTQSWLRYLLYIQATLMFITIITQTYTALNVLL
jgi:hypothetical protein